MCCIADSAENSARTELHNSDIPNSNNANVRCVKMNQQMFNEKGFERPVQTANC